MSDAKQQMIGVRMDAALISEIDRIRGPVSRSDFVRAAVYDALVASGSSLPPESSLPPDRTGIGGPRKKKEPMSSEGRGRDRETG